MRVLTSALPRRGRAAFFCLGQGGPAGAGDGSRPLGGIRRRWLLWTLLVLLLPLVTLPLPAQIPKWKFIVVGDTRGTDSNNQINSVILAELAQAIAQQKPSFVLVPGDLVDAGTPAAFQAWTNLMAPVYRAGIGVYPVLGNHDLTSIPGWTNVFGATLPNNGPVGEIDRTYFFTFANALVLNLDNYVNAGRVNQSWINAVLATNSRPHVFVQGHMPAFKANHTDCLDDYPAARNAFWNSLSNANCRIYFSGHDHFYDHTRIDDGDGDPEWDIHQMIVGSGGAPLVSTYAYDGLNSPFTPQAVYHEQQYGYVLVEVDGFAVKTTWYHRTGVASYAATSEVFAYTVKSTVPLLSFAYNNQSLTLAWTAGAVLQSSPSPKGPFTNAKLSPSPLVVTNFSPPALFYRVVAIKGTPSQ